MCFPGKQSLSKNIIFIPEYIFLFHEVEIILCREKPETQKTCKINWPLSTNKIW